MKKMLFLLALTFLCAGCATRRSAEESYQLQLLNDRMERVENRILELDRDIAYLFDERIRTIKKTTCKK